MGRIGLTELIVILAIVMLLFGSKKLPELADGLGKAIRNFKKGVSTDDADERDVTPADKQMSTRSSATDVTSKVHGDATPTGERKS